MIELLSTLIPLNIASTLSPGILALAVLLLASRWHPKSRITALLLGTAIVGVIAGLLGFTFGKSAFDPEPNFFSSTADLLIGIFFVFFAFKALLIKERKIKTSNVDTGKQFFKWMAIGLAASATNFDALVLTFIAGKEVGASVVSGMAKSLFLFMNLLFFTLPVALPLIIYLFFPNLAERSLAVINRFVLKYCKYLIFILFLFLGLVFIKRGMEFFMVI